MGMLGKAEYEEALRCHSAAVSRPLKVPTYEAFITQPHEIALVDGRRVPYCITMPAEGGPSILTVPMEAYSTDLVGALVPASCLAVGGLPMSVVPAASSLSRFRRSAKKVQAPELSIDQSRMWGRVSSLSGPFCVYLRSKGIEPDAHMTGSLNASAYYTGSDLFEFVAFHLPEAVGVFSVMGSWLYWDFTAHDGTPDVGTAILVAAHDYAASHGLLLNLGVAWFPWKRAWDNGNITHHPGIVQDLHATR